MSKMAPITPKAVLREFISFKGEKEGGENYPIGGEGGTHP